MRSIWAIGATAVLAVTLAGCSGGGSPTATATTSGTGGGATPSATAVVATSAAAPASAVPVNLDPCQLVTQQEASALTGVAFGPGQRDDVPNGEKRCVYGSQTKNVFTVGVVQGSSVAEAQAYKDQLKAEAEQKLGTVVNLSPVPGVADDAESLSGNIGAGLSVSGLYLLKGAIGVGIVDVALGASAPTVAAMTGQATTVVSRLP